MQTSELIQRLKQELKKHGDVPVIAEMLIVDNKGEPVMGKRVALMITYGKETKFAFTLTAAQTQGVPSVQPDQGNPIK